MCYNACSIKAHRVNGTVVKIEGNPDSPQNVDKICAKAQASIMSLYSPTRIKAPLKRTNPEKGIGVDPKWAEISWDEALDTVVEKLKKVREEDPRKLVIQSFDKVFLNDFNFHAAFASAFKTPNFGYGAACYFCGSNLHPVGYLTNAAFHFEPDVHHTNYLILIGAQHGFLAGEDAVGGALRMSNARLRGMKVVVIDPVCSSAGAKADEWIPIRP
jgi:molybdopterin-containing oxidoreductase family molybdopterin binding subunit